MRRRTNRLGIPLILLLLLACRGPASAPTPTLPPTVVIVIPTAPAASPTEAPTPEPTATAPAAGAGPLPATDGPPPVIDEAGRVYLGDVLLVNPEVEAPGCFSGGIISHAPTRAHFLVVLDCFEGDNTLFLFTADGGNKRRITGEWDVLNYRNVEWSPDGQSFTYRRVNSCCANPPSGTVLPVPGLVRVDVHTGAKEFLSTFRVIDVAADDVLNIRAGPGVQHLIAATIPPDGRGVRVTGDGVMVGDSLWVPVTYGSAAGWVNLRFLLEE